VPLASKNPRIYLYAVLSPLVVVIVVSIFTVFIAIRHADRPIAEAYVKNGLSISNDLRLQDTANALGLAVKLVCTEQPPILLLTSSSQGFLAPNNLLLRFVHMADEKLDWEFLLNLSGEGQYSLPAAMIDADGNVAPHTAGFWMIQAVSTSSSTPTAHNWQLRVESLSCITLAPL